MLTFRGVNYLIYINLMIKNRSDLNPTGRGEDLRLLCRQYVQHRGTEQEKQLSDQIARLVLTNPDIRAIAWSALRRYGHLGSDRLEELLSELAAVVVIRLLPRMRDPDAIWGALKGCARNLVLDYTRNPYDSELPFTADLDDPKVGAALVPVESDTLRLDTTMMAKKAHAQLAAALAAPPAREDWIPVPIPPLDGQLPGAPVPLAELSALPAKPTRAPRTAKIASAGQLELREIKTKLQMTIPELAAALSSNPNTLSAYMKGIAPLPDEVLERARLVFRAKFDQVKHQNDRWKQIAGKSGSMAKMIAEWKERAGVRTNRELAQILDVSETTITRWSQDLNIPPPHRMRKYDGLVDAAGGKAAKT